jgi:hypothetical protein
LSIWLFAGRTWLTGAGSIANIAVLQWCLSFSTPAKQTESRQLFYLRLFAFADILEVVFEWLG